MDNEDVDFDWEGLECDILRSISMKAFKNALELCEALELCAINEVTNLGIFGKKTMMMMLFLSRHSRLHSLFSSLSFRIYFSTSSEGSFRAKVDLNTIF